MSWLNRVCAGDPAMASEVASLLVADGGGGTSLERTIGAAVGLLQGSSPASPPTGSQGAPVGYRLKGHLGFGGTSTVALAEDPEGRKVALKVVRPELASRIGGRFASEQQLLRRLQHPGIARLLDAGSLANGLPYVATEYVEGVPIDRALAGQSSRKILEVFLEICDAVHHAHCNLVIHRDLKPANILAAADLHPKLLDFGLARLLEPDPSREPTATAHRMLTPSCASPEQLRGEVLTTATDVYSLGVLLYTLLAGSHPQEKWRRSPVAFARAIQEEEPIPLSQLTRQGERQSLPKDLDAVVAKALHKDPALRYGSVEGLQNDLRRVLAGRPVAARRSTFTYRVSRFLRRHRWAAAASGVVMILLIGVGVLLWQKQQNSHRARERAQQSLEILVQLLGAADPYQAGGEALSVRTLLDHTAQRLDGYLLDQPDVRALLLDAVGTLYLRIRALDEAEALLDEALRLQRSGADLGSAATAKLLRHHGELKDFQGDFVASESFYRLALEEEEDASGEALAGLAASCNGLGDSLHGQGRYDEARPHYERALRLRRGLFGNEHSAVAETLNHLAVLEHEQRHLERAESLYRTSLALRRRVLGAEHPAVAQSLNNLSALLREQGRLEEGGRLLKEAVRMEQELFGKSSPRLVSSLQNLAMFSFRQEDLGQAKKILASIEGIFTEVGWLEAPDRATNFYHLGLVAKKEGNGEAAEIHHRRALELYGRSLPELHVWTSYPSLELGNLLLESGRALEAEELLRRSVEARRSTYDGGHWRTGEAECSLAAALVALGRSAEARDLLEAGVATLEREFGPATERTLEAKKLLAEL